tara:strand:- start:621 stop:791 length:171 start_codon:yes stop_codon:yes gene_type:complete
MSKELNLVGVDTFAKLAGIDRIEAYSLIKPQRIIPTVIGTKKFIDINKYNPKNYKK